MKKILGILGLLVVICIVTAMISDRFYTSGNIENLIRRTAPFAILGIGVGMVIITGGIDLSLGSVIALVGVLMPQLLVQHGWPIGGVIVAMLGLAALIGLIHGLLITKVGLQPFVVTLCGLLIYRGAARGITDDQTRGFGLEFDALRELAVGKIPITDDFGLPVPAVVMVVIAIIAAVFLNQTIFGRYLLALGRNEQAARYSGINTDRMVILAYVICSLLGGLAGMIFVLDTNTAQPADFGNFYELYAIAAAVLGGCSLRGGEGSITGIIIGAAVMLVLRNAILLVGIPTQLEFAIVGLVLLGGVVADEMIKRLAAARRAKAAAERSVSTAGAAAVRG
jgi:ribose transport system permease protein